MEDQSGPEFGELGSHTFTWVFPAEEVFVTGYFDNWEKSVKMERRNGVFRKTVKLPRTRTMYKLIVDGD